MMKALRALFAKICGALPIVALIVCMVGGMSTDESAGIQPVRKVVNIRARPSKPEESDDIVSLRQRAEQGDIDAQIALGIRYYNGKDVPQNYAEAIKLLRCAAEQGDAWAQLVLCGMYVLGQGIPQNFKEAYIWASIAAANGYDSTEIAKALSEDLVKKGKEVITATGQRDTLARKLLPADLSAAQAEATERHAAIQEKMKQNEKKD